MSSKTENRPGPHPHDTGGDGGCSDGHEQPEAAKQREDVCCGGHTHEHKQAGHSGCCHDHAATE